MINLVIGRQGSGKTLLLIRKAYEYYKNGKTIYSNVHLKFPYKQINYNDIVNCKYQDAIILIDEIHQLIPSRNSMSRRNRTICDSFLSMVRKKHVIIWASTQTQRKVDIRFREEADFIYETEKFVKVNNKWYHPIQSQTFSKDIKVLIKVSIFDVYSRRILKKAFIGNDLYNLFDTNQIILIKNLDIDNDD